MSDYKNLFAWQKTDALAAEVYRVTASFPKSELYGIVSQLRRAALSVPTNIVEGNNRGTSNDFKRFLDIAYGSLLETEYLIGFSERLGYISDRSSGLRDIYSLIIESKKLIIGLKRSL